MTATLVQVYDGSIEFIDTRANYHSQRCRPQDIMVLTVTEDPAALATQIAEDINHARTRESETDRNR